MSERPDNILQAGAQVSTSLIESLKGGPACVAAIALSAVFATLTYFAMQNEAERRSKTVDILIARCFPLVKGADDADPEKH